MNLVKELQEMNEQAGINPGCEPGVGAGSVDTVGADGVNSRHHQAQPTLLEQLGAALAFIRQQMEGASLASLSGRPAQVSHARAAANDAQPVGYRLPRQGTSHARAAANDAQRSLGSPAQPSPESPSQPLSPAGEARLFHPKVAILTGSGLSRLSERIQTDFSLDYRDIPYLPATGMRGHPGHLLFGHWAGQPVLGLVGRLHTYEGHTALQTAFPVLLAYGLGARVLVVTNAAGAINRDFSVGQIMLIKDHINFTGQNPISFNNAENLAEVVARYGTRSGGLADDWEGGNTRAKSEPGASTAAFPNEGAGLDMTFAYTPALRQRAHQAASELGVTLQEGVYLGVRGASFETPSEIRAFRLWGADAVGMSTVHEVLVAARLGMQVLGLSLLSNMAAGITSEALNANDIITISAASTSTLANLIEQCLASARP
ncbi:MAG: purine-nucleoside phosphorylase [Coriobacteriales bacterium]|nr:purine-nucleoside phosphorylase [Coriobacteriales bacterium]